MTHLDVDLLGGLDSDCVKAIRQISHNHAWELDAVTFSECRYILCVLGEIGLVGYFPPGRVFGVTNVLPHCKPDARSFKASWPAWAQGRRRR